jgi:hypothetical protein
VIGDLVVLVGIVVVAGAAGIALGMLLAPRIGRLMERGDETVTPEESGDDRQS